MFRHLFRDFPRRVRTASGWLSLGLLTTLPQPGATRPTPFEQHGRADVLPIRQLPSRAWRVQTAVANDPWNADYMHNLAMSMRRQGDVASAEQVLRQAVELDPGHQPSHHGLALVLKDQGRTAEAHSHLSTGSPSSRIRPKRTPNSPGAARIRGLRRRSAIAATSDADQAERPIIASQMGQIYEDTNQPALARSMYQKSLYAKWYQPKCRPACPFWMAVPSPGEPRGATRHLHQRHRYRVRVWSAG